MIAICDAASNALLSINASYCTSEIDELVDTIKGYRQYTKTKGVPNIEMIMSRCERPLRQSQGKLTGVTLAPGVIC